MANTDSFAITANARTGTSVDGSSNFSFSGTTTVTKNGTNGWGSQGSGGGNISVDRALTLQFDLGGLPPNTGLRITDVVGVDAGNNGQNVQVVVDGVSTTLLGGLTGTNLMLDLQDGDLVAFRNGGTSDSEYRLRSLTVETFTLAGPVPEPSTLALAALGLMGLTFRRRRRR